MLLARQLVSNYEQAKPNLVSVVLESNGFKDLLDKLTFLRDAQQQQQAIITITQQAKARADAAARHLAALEATDRQITVATAQRVRALAGMNLLLHSKQSALQQARSAQQQALEREPCQGRRAAGADREDPGRAGRGRPGRRGAAGGAVGTGSAPTPAGPTYGPSGGWAIPYSIVLCESGGQNLTPNSAGASGYYQILPEHLEAVRRYRPGGLSGQQGGAGRGGEPDLERRRRRVQLGLRRHRRDPPDRAAGYRP